MINLTKGTQYTLSYSDYANRAGGQYKDWFQVWIDYNRNGVFEISELVGAKSAIPNANKRHTGTIVCIVPAVAYSGDKTLRMRVASTFFNTTSDPCGSPIVPVNGGGFISAGSFRDFPVKITGALAVDEVKGTNSEIEIYPNPADTFVEVKSLKGKADYKIYSAEGRLVQSGKLDGQRINVSSLIKGMYIITITSETKTHKTKLIKK
ncbi:T9SS type A sorting domain-containing protein [Chryseobacterium sp. OV279]|uniref:T9SS type A sorting domain-containing protein n=1 Tax=Chryseobacterium sp. OV279 TaxID=1500285 RepID=UPI0009355444|nr:T9SS type A sorting domain-containing protein [Chryseobacterium sp. OV279]